MDAERIDQLLKYAILVAGSEDYENRKLGPIHLIKFVYLGDLAYAEEHPKETFTSAPWRFFHYGPWAQEVYARIEPTMADVGARRHIFTSQFDKDAVRFELTDESQRQAIEKQLPFEVERAIRNAVHEYGQATSDLLHFVYRTWPMLHAAPNELLSFDFPIREPVEKPTGSQQQIEESQLSKTARRKREEKIQVAREQIRMTIERRRLTRKRIPPPITPRYDDVYFEGAKMLDDIGGSPVEPIEGEIEITDEIWKSPFRTESDLP